MTNRLAGLALLTLSFAACGGGAGGAAGALCPTNTKECGTGCIPSQGVCCDDGMPPTSSYCTNAAGGGCSANTRECQAGFSSGTTAAFCCADQGTIGSNDCPAGQHHCGLLCQSTPCCPGPGCPGSNVDAGTDAASGGGGASGGAGGTGPGGSGGAGGTGPGGSGSAGASGVTGGGGTGPGGGGGSNVCCACHFDVACTAFGLGGCWYCSDSVYIAGTCDAPSTYLSSPGACVCDSGLYQVCQ